MKKSVVIIVVSLATSIFGIEPSELVRLYRTALTNSETMVELKEVLKEHSRESIWEIQSRMNGLELLLMCPAIDSVSGTSEKLTITFRGSGYFVQHNGVIRSTTEYAENNEPLILTPDQEVRIYEYHASFRLVPVSFKDKRKGFKVTDMFDANSFGDGERHSA